ncbi:hypothetical protein Acy02nite_02740 [Actinoplanes cyaneus]|uniref:Uncharacterized protein n=1 Tax=Actinoplanes cyaneus TaxID=52696 RepID=A0A919M2Q8_9ACTN|nr:hypothetical protein [Actinoplanes cyaneus]MCW2143521.1 hypothetical protein [Actinoplanes cyaneus]GID62393.1 hypothetical protein Acy02nite_02740 [Actinoplanes cyaneus]
MPQLVTVRVQRPSRRLIRFWLPVLPVALVFSPLLMLAALVAVVACVVYRISVLQAFVTGWRFFCALSGTRVDVHEGRSAVLVTIR